MSAPGENELVPDSVPVTVDPEPSPDPEGVSIPEGTINVHEACAIARKLHGSQVSDRKYYIKGWVTGFNRGDSFDQDFPKYGNDFVYITATAPDAPISSKRQFLAYRLLGQFGAKFPDLECIKVGDFIVISCYITNFGGTIESSGACFTYSSVNEHYNDIFKFAFNGCPEPGEGEISVTEAEKIARSMDKSAEQEARTTKESYKIRGVVSSVETTSIDPKYGNMVFNITDGITYATCYRLKGKNNTNFKDVNQVQPGDTILVNAKIQNFQDICEPVQGYVEDSSNPNF